MPGRVIDPIGFKPLIVILSHLLFTFNMPPKKPRSAKYKEAPLKIRKPGSDLKKKVIVTLPPSPFRNVNPTRNSVPIQSASRRGRWIGAPEKPRQRALPTKRTHERSAKWAALLRELPTAYFEAMANGKPMPEAMEPAEPVDGVFASENCACKKKARTVTCIFLCRKYGGFECLGGQTNKH